MNKTSVQLALFLIGTAVAEPCVRESEFVFRVKEVETFFNQALIRSVRVPLSKHPNKSGLVSLRPCSRFIVNAPNDKNWGKV